MPLVLADAKCDQLILEKLRLAPGKLDLDDWKALIQRIVHPKHEITIGVVGKYIEHRDAYKSIYESLAHAGMQFTTRVLVRRIESDELTAANVDSKLGGLHGILVPGGFGHRGIEGKIEAIRYARTHEIPYFGICLGMQTAVIEFSRNVAGLAGANSTEFDPDSPHPVICLLETQKGVKEKGRRCGWGPNPVSSSKAPSRPRPTAARPSVSDIATATSSTPPIASVSKQRACASPATARTARWLKWWNSRTTHGSWLCSSTRSSSRSHWPLTRCSRVSSRPGSRRCRTRRWGRAARRQPAESCRCRFDLECHLPHVGQVRYPNDYTASNSTSLDQR